MGHPCRHGELDCRVCRLVYLSNPSLERAACAQNLGRFWLHLEFLISEVGMCSHSEQVVPKWSTTCTGMSLLMPVFLIGVMYMYYFWPLKAGLVVIHAKVTCEMRYFKETNMEFLLPWPVCAASPPETLHLLLCDCLFL